MTKAISPPHPRPVGGPAHTIRCEREGRVEEVTLRAVGVSTLIYGAGAWVLLTLLYLRSKRHQAENPTEGLGAGVLWRKLRRRHFGADPISPPSPARTFSSVRIFQSGGAAAPDPQWLSTSTGPRPCLNASTQALPGDMRHSGSFFIYTQLTYRIAMKAIFIELPYAGDVIPGTGGLRKVRFLDARRGMKKMKWTTRPPKNVRPWPPCCTKN